MSPLDPTLTYYPRPSVTIRLAGISAILGAILWPVSLVFIGAGGIECTASGCSGDRAVLGFLALAPILLTVGVVGLELRARREPALVDLIGDLSIGTAAVLSALAFVLGPAALFLPGLLLLLIGSAIFGVGGYLRRRAAANRQRARRHRGWSVPLLPDRRGSRRRRDRRRDRVVDPDHLQPGLDLAWRRSAARPTTGRPDQEGARSAALRVDQAGKSSGRTGRRAPPPGLQPRNGWITSIARSMSASVL